MKNKIEKYRKIIISSIIIAMILFSSCSPIIVYAAETGGEASGGAVGEASAAASHTLTTDKMNVYFQGNQFERFIIDGNENANTYCLRGASSAYNGSTYNKETKLENATNGDGLNFRYDQTKSVKAIQWIVENMYYYTNGTSSAQKKVMKEHLLNLIAEYGGNYSNITNINNLSDDLIYTAQQFVIWMYVNHNGYTNYFWGFESKLDGFSTS